VSAMIVSKKESLMHVMRYASATRRCATETDDVTLMLRPLMLLMMICLIGEIFLSGLITALVEATYVM